jgi:hypothetical protein
MNKQELIKMSIEWCDSIIEKCKRLTTGNVSHNAANIRGFAIRCAEYLTKHNPNCETIVEVIGTFNNIAEKASRLTSGNVSHQSANIICVASLRRSLLKLENK